MSIIASTTSAPREVIPAGNYVARCYKMIQIGTVEEIIQGEKKLLQKVRIGWEFPNDQKVFSEEKGPQPIVFDEEYTLSMGEKSNLRKMLASWRGKDFSADEAKGFDITKLIGVACMVNIIHKPKIKNPTEVYSKIGSVSGTPKGISIPAQINKTFILSYDEFDFEKFNSLPDFIKDKMKTSSEFKELTQAQPLNTAPTAKQIEPLRTVTGSPIQQPEPVDDLPF